jgi:anti-sigma B factor antagonist
MESQPSEHFDLRVTPEQTEVTFNDRKLNDFNFKDIGEQLYQLVEETRPSRLRLDFGRVDFLTSTVLGKLLGLHRRLNANRGALVLDNVNPGVYEVFESTGLTFFMNVRKKVEA